MKSFQHKAQTQHNVVISTCSNNV